MKKTAEWLAAERGFGIDFLDFVRQSGGKTSVNFRATTADGRRFFVKLARKRAQEKAEIVDRDVESPLVGKMAFGGRTFPCGGWMCFAYPWIADVRSVRPQDLTPRQIRSLVEAYGRLSAALENVNVGEGRERPIHGDLHYDNIFFRGDEVVAFFDFEMMRRGLPTEDLVRVFCHRLERTRFWRVMTIRRILAAFRELVRVSPYPKADWLEAIDRAEREKKASRQRKRKGAFWTSVDSALKSGTYRGLRKCIE